MSIVSDYEALRWRDERDAAIRILDDHRTAVADATTRLERIAESHAKEVDEHGGVSGFCGECDHSWPCPTYRWATAPTVDINCTWDLDDCEFDHEHDQYDVPLAAEATHRCPHCGVVCPDPDVAAWLTEHRPVCTVKPT